MCLILGFLVLVTNKKKNSVFQNRLEYTNSNECAGFDAYLSHRVSPSSSREAPHERKYEPIMINKSLLSTAHVGVTHNLKWHLQIWTE